MSFSLPLILVLHAAQPALNPVVEAEEIVFRYTPADNGSGPLWCFGSTCLVRAGERVGSAHCFATGGYVLTGDMWRAPDGRVHIVWPEYPIHPKLRQEHFPDIKRTQESLKYALLRDGKILLRRTLVEGGEGDHNRVPG